MARDRDRERDERADTFRSVDPPAPTGFHREPRDSRETRAPHFPRMGTETMEHELQETLDWREKIDATLYGDGRHDPGLSGDVRELARKFDDFERKFEQFETDVEEQAKEQRLALNEAIGLMRQHGKRLDDALSVHSANVASSSHAVIQAITQAVLASRYPVWFIGSAWTAVMLGGVYAGVSLLFRLGVMKGGGQ